MFLFWLVVGKPGGNRLIRMPSDGTGPFECTNFVYSPSGQGSRIQGGGQDGHPLVHSGPRGTSETGTPWRLKGVTIAHTLCATGLYPTVHPSGPCAGAHFLRTQKISADWRGFRNSGRSAVSPEMTVIPLAGAKGVASTDAPALKGAGTRRAGVPRLRVYKLTRAQLPHRHRRVRAGLPSAPVRAQYRLVPWQIADRRSVLPFGSNVPPARAGR